MDKVIKRPPLQEYLLDWILTYGVRSDGWGEDGWRNAENIEVPDRFDEPRIYQWTKLERHGYMWQSKDEKVIKITAKGKRVAYGKEQVPSDLVLWQGE